MVIDEEVAVADASAGDNIISGHEQERVGYKRWIVATGLVGGNAIGQPIVDIKVAGKVVDTIRGQATGLALINTNMLGSRTKVPANQLVEAEVKTAPTVSPVRIRLVFAP